MDTKELIKALNDSLIGNRLSVIHIKNLIERLQELEELKRGLHECPKGRVEKNEEGITQVKKKSTLYSCPGV